MIHMPSRSSQKYPYGLSLKLLCLQFWSVLLMQLLSLPSMALRLVANRQFCLRFGVATSEIVLPCASLVSATLKQGVAGASGLTMSAAQGFNAKVPFGSFWLIDAYASK